MSSRRPRAAKLRLQAHSHFKVYLSLLALVLLAGCEHINLTHYSQIEQPAEPAPTQSQSTAAQSNSQHWAISDSGWWQRMMQESLRVGPYTVANSRPGWIKENSHYPSATEIRRETTQPLSFDLQRVTTSLPVSCEYRSVEQGTQGRRSAGGTSTKTIKDARMSEQSIRCLSEEAPLWLWQWSEATGWSGSGSGIKARLMSNGIEFTAASGEALALWQQQASRVDWKTKAAEPSQQQVLAAAIAALVISGQSEQ